MGIQDQKVHQIAIFSELVPGTFIVLLSFLRFQITFDLWTKLPRVSERQMRLIASGSDNPSMSKCKFAAVGAVQGRLLRVEGTPGRHRLGYFLGPDFYNKELTPCKLNCCRHVTLGTCLGSIWSRLADSAGL
eukprot:2151088-Amphidinium_carterae.1